MLDFVPPVDYNNTNLDKLYRESIDDINKLKENLKVLQNMVEVATEKASRYKSYYESLYDDIKTILGPERYEEAKNAVLSSGNQGMDTMLVIAIEKLRDEAGDYDHITKPAINNEKKSEAMITEALINGNMQNLTDNEAKAAENFHSNRLAFVFLGTKMKIHFCDFGDKRDHQHWLLEDFGITPDEFEKVPRGYIKFERVQLFKGSSFEPLDLHTVSKINKLAWEEITKRYKELFGPGNAKVFNGVHVGKIGEVWEPMETLFGLSIV